MSTPAQDVQWLLHGPVGTSSKFIWAVMNGADPVAEAGHDPFGAYPHDPDDFSRCYLLLQRNPNWRWQLHTLAPAGPEWAALVEHWGELEQMFLEIFGGSYDLSKYRSARPFNSAASRRMYDRMAEIKTAARAAKERV